jgi:hypothetical protein
MGDMTRRGRAGGPHHHGRADIRGLAGRARAIRAALTGGYHPDRLTAAITAGEPWRQQLALFPTPTAAEPPQGASGALRQPPSLTNRLDRRWPAATRRRVSLIEQGEV